MATLTWIMTFIFLVICSASFFFFYNKMVRYLDRHTICEEGEEKKALEFLAWKNGVFSSISVIAMPLMFIIAYLI